MSMFVFVSLSRNSEISEDDDFGVGSEAHQWETSIINGKFRLLVPSMS